MIIILEGPDNTGKTTWSKRGQYANSIIYHEEYHKGCMLQQARDSVIRAWEHDGVFIFDRCFISNLVYSTVLGQKAEITLSQVQEFLRRLNERDLVIKIFLPTDKYRWMDEYNGKENYTRSQLDTLYDSYLALAKLLEQEFTVSYYDKYVEEAKGLKNEEYPTSTDRKYVQLLADIVTRGCSYVSTNGDVIELLGNCTQWYMGQPLVSVKERKLNYKFAHQKAYAAITGSSLLEDHDAISGFDRYSDEGLFLRGAYGPAFVDNISYLVEKLYYEENTRHATCAIWRNSPRSSRDIPSLVSLSWCFRYGKLDCHAFMRSSDAFLGLPYDLYTISCMSAYLLSCIQEISISPTHHILGKLYLYTVTQHVYTKDMEKVKELINQTKYTFNDPVTVKSCRTAKEYRDELKKRI